MEMMSHSRVLQQSAKALSFVGRRATRWKDCWREESRWFWDGSEMVNVARERSVKFLGTVVKGGTTGVRLDGKVDGSLPVITVERAIVL